MSNVTIRSEKSVFQSPVFEIIRSEIERNGEVHIHDNVILADDVFILPLTEQNEVYLVSQYRYLLGKEILEMIAGVIDPGEEPDVAARRELKEEAGLTARRLKKITTFYRGASFIKGKWHLYVAQDLEEGEQEPDGFEDIRVVKMPLAEAVKKVETGEIFTTGAVSSILLVDHLLREGKI